MAPLAPSPPEVFALPLSQANALDELADEFEGLLRQGKNPSPDEFLDRAPPDTRAMLREELTAIAAEMGAISGPPSPLPPANAPGQAAPRLGEYELLELLGQGGMGAVYRARHRRLGQVVALKQIRPDRPIRPDRRERFEREIQIVGRMQHPHLVEALYAGEEAGTLFLVMRHVEGTDLQRLVEMRGPLDVPQACTLARQTALGLEYIGRQGLVHRDIKPSNLMLARPALGGGERPIPTLKVLDLGLARLCEAGPDLTSSGLTLGTPDYLAPEQARAPSRAGITADLYSLGCVLFFLLTGRPPFAHRSGLYEKMKAHVEEPPPDVRALRPEVPAALAELLGRLLAKDPADRPQQPAEVAAILEPLAAGADLAGLLPLPGHEQAAAALAPTVDRAPTTGPQTPLAEGGTPAVAVAPQPAANSAPATLPKSAPPGWRPRRRDWPLLASGLAAAALFLALVLFFNTLGQKPSPGLSTRKDQRDSSAPKQTPPESRVRITRFEVRHYAGQGDGKLVLPQGVLGEKSFAVRWNDQVKLHVELSRPAHFYVLGFNANGDEQLLWPEQKQQVPKALARLDFPTDTDAGWTLDDEPRGGVQGFAVVVGRGRLPAYAAWKKSRPALVWKRIAVSGQDELVWRGNGRLLDEFFPGGVRAKKEELGGIGSLARLARKLRQSPGVADVSLVAFPLWPR